MPLTHSQLNRLPIRDVEITHNKVRTFGHGKLTVVEIETHDAFMGVGMCRMSDQDIMNDKFRTDPDYAAKVAKWRAAESVRRQRKGKGIHHLLMR